MRASLWAAAVTAALVPSLARMWRNQSPNVDLEKAERHFLLMHFCENYYKAGCAHTDLDQINFLSDPTYYIDPSESKASLVNHAGS